MNHIGIRGYAVTTSIDGQVKSRADSRRYRQKTFFDPLARSRQLTALGFIVRKAERQGYAVTTFIEPEGQPI